MRRNKKSYGHCLVAVAVAISLAVLICPSANASSRLYKVEAAILYNFFNYITWPEKEAPQALEEPVICINRNDPIEPYLQHMQEKVQQERRLHIRELTTPDMLDGCHMLYTQRHLRHGLVQRAYNNNTLIIAAGKQPQNQAMINLFPKDKRIAMAINRSDLEASGFKVSSRLLTLAEKVQ